MSISAKVQRKLLAASGGFCGNPSCHKDLFEFFDSGEIASIEELAHIIGQKENGPRGKDDLPMSNRDEYDNIILLCPTCHTLVDKSPHLFPKETIMKWKREHQESISDLFMAPVFQSRKQAREYVAPLFAENKAVFEMYGPYSNNALKDPLSTERIWERLSIQTLIPNNRKIESAVSRNLALVTDAERLLFAQFQLHREGFEFNKLSGDVNAIVPTFPDGFDSIFI